MSASQVEAPEAGTSESSSTEITFKVKTSGNKTHTVTMSESATVADLKTKLSGEDMENIPVGRQRLIYSGRVMKNEDALGVYKIKSGNTIHLVKSAASNPNPPAAGQSSASAASAVPQNMAAGTPAGNIMAGLTGARYAGYNINLPGREAFGADGGMGAPPNEDQMARMLSDPNVLQAMNEALNNPQFIDHMIQMNPMLAAMPNAREIITSPYFRSMLTDPQALRSVARLRQLMGGQPHPSFPAPGVVDGSQQPENNNNNNNNGPSNGALPNIFGPGTMGGNPGAASNPFAALFSAPPGTAGTTPGGQTGGAAGGAPGQGAAPSQAQSPLAALLGVQLAQPGYQMSLETLQNIAQFLGSVPPAAGGGGASPTAPADNRPPEERYADQLRQLNDMGFFDFERNVTALRRSGGSVQGAIEHLLSGT